MIKFIVTFLFTNLLLTCLSTIFAGPPSGEYLRDIFVLLGALIGIVALFTGVWWWLTKLYHVMTK